MADYDRKPTIIGRDADAADGANPIGRLAQAAEDTRDNASGVAPECEDLDIVFEREDSPGVRH